MVTSRDTVTSSLSCPLIEHLRKMVDLQKVYFPTTKLQYVSHEKMVKVTTCCSLHIQGMKGRICWDWVCVCVCVCGGGGGGGGDEQNNKLTTSVR